MGRREIPFVTKIDRHDRIARERVAVEGVENLLGATSPRLADYVDLETRGAIKYHFATMYAGEVRTLQRAFREADGPAAARALFDRVIDRLLRRLYQSPQLDRLDLFAYYGYQPRYAEATLARVAELGGEAANGSLLVPGLPEPLPHPRRFYERLHGSGTRHERRGRLRHRPRRPEPGQRAARRRPGNTWLIDYFWTRVGHVLDDVAKLENDLKFIMLPLPDDAALALAFELEQHLGRQEDLLVPPGDPPPELLASPALAKVHAAVARLRELAAELLREAGLALPVSAREYRIAQLRYSAHTLSFVECDERQKRFALASTCLLANRLEPTLGGG